MTTETTNTTAASSPLDGAVRPHDVRVAAWIDRSGHPHHLSHVQGVQERKLYGPLQPLFDGAELRIVVARAAEVERIKLRALLMEMHERDKHKHNYWACAAVEIFGSREATTAEIDAEQDDDPEELAASTARLLERIESMRNAWKRVEDAMPSRSDERHLRRLLALRVAMPNAYYDDGEEQGSEHGISIDFMREPVADIDAKLRALNVARAELTNPLSQDAELLRMLLEGKHELGVFVCDKDGQPCDSVSAAEVLQRLHALLGA